MKWVLYHSNNSGGDWWLKDEDWLKLEEAGWKVFWTRNGDINIDVSGELAFRSLKNGEERWLGALAKECAKQFNTLQEGIDEWEKITGQDHSDAGCSCCGSPHYFDSGYTKDNEPLTHPYQGLYDK